MEKGLTKKLSLIMDLYKKDIQRYQVVNELFFNNLIMQDEVKDFRKKYDMPENGFEHLNSETAVFFDDWLQKLKESYPERWDEPPPDFDNNEEDWEEIPFINDDYPSEPLEIWEPNCYINVKDFQQGLHTIYDRFNKVTPLNNYSGFELYAVHNIVPLPINSFGSLEARVTNQPRREELLSSEQDKGGNIIEHILLKPAYESIVEGIPTLSVEKQGGQVTQLTLNIKPNTIIENIKAVWDEVEKYQKKMAGYSPKIKLPKHYKRNVELLKLKKSKNLSYTELIRQWNNNHPIDTIVVETSAIQRALERLEKSFKPSDT